MWGHTDANNGQRSRPPRRNWSLSSFWGQQVQPRDPDLLSWTNVADLFSRLISLSWFFSLLKTVNRLLTCVFFSQISHDRTEQAHLRQLQPRHPLRQNPEGHPAAACGGEHCTRAEAPGGATPCRPEHSPGALTRGGNFLGRWARTPRVHHARRCLASPVDQRLICA